MTVSSQRPLWGQEYTRCRKLREVAGLETWECWSESVHHLVKVHSGPPGPCSPEFDFLSSLDHPAFPRVHSYECHSGVSCLIRDYVSGAPLAHDFGKLNAEAVAEILVQLARALAALHFRGVVHGDLHAENIIYDPDELRISLIDFEFLSPKHQSTEKIRGNPAVMAPELFWGAPPTIQTDLYAIGCVLYGMVGGHYPFLQKTLSELIHFHAFEMPPDPTSFHQGFPRALGLLALRLLNKEPGARMASANDVIREVNGIFDKRAALEVPPKKISSWQRLQVARTFSWQNQAMQFLENLQDPSPEERKMLAELYLKTGRLEDLERVIQHLSAETAWLYQGLMLNRKGQYDQALQHLLVDRPLENTQAILALSTAFYYTGHVEEALNTLEQSGPKLQSSPRGRALLANHQGNLYFFERRLNEAELTFGQAITGAREAGDVHLEAMALMNLANLQQGLHLWGMALENYDKALELFTGLGQALDQIKVQLNLAGLTRFLGHLEKSEDLVENSLRMLRVTPNPQLMAYAFLLQADLEKKMGNHRPALFNLLDAESYLSDFPSAVDRGDLYSSRAEVLFALNEQVQLLELLDQAHLYALKLKDKILDQRVQFLKTVMEGLRMGQLVADSIISLGESLINGGDSEFVLDNIKIAKDRANQTGVEWPDILFSWSIQKIQKISTQIPEDYRAFFLNHYRSLNEESPMLLEEKNAMEPLPGKLDASLIQILAWVRELTSEWNVSELTKKILHRLLEFTKMERGYVILKDADRLIVAHSYRMEPGETSGEDGLSWSLTTKALEQGEYLLTTDAQNDSRLVGANSINSLKLKAILVLPFLNDGKTLGAVYLDSKLQAHHLQQKEIPYLMGLSNLIGIALQNATKFQETEQNLEKTKIELRRTQNELKTKYQYNQIIGQSSVMKLVLQKVDRVTEVQAPVLILGESGVGKELFAKAIHFNGPLKDGPWVAANCSAIPENLVESEFFGHERGAFTGAMAAREGLFEQANRGTLFLDEIGDMPLLLQAKLLRVLHEQEVRRVGGTTTRPVKVRIIAATHRDLKKEIKAGRFREDLFYRLSVAEIFIPPLRDRTEDIPFLVHHFLKKFAKENSTPLVRLDPHCLNLLQIYPWKGNVRELENLIYHICIFSSGEQVGIDALAQKPEFKEWLKKVDPNENVSTEKAEKLSGAIDRGELNLSEAKRRFEREEIVRVLALKEGKVGESAKHLGVPRPQLSRLLKYHGLGPHGG